MTGNPSRKLKISHGKDRYEKTGFKVGEVTWEELVAKLTRFVVTPETFEEYKASETKLAIKDTGWWVGGPFEPAVRRKSHLQFRSVLTLDLDHLDPWDVGTVITSYGVRDLDFLLHSSHSHSEDEPRLRLVMPMTRDVTPVEYEAIGRKVASWFAMDPFDDTGFQCSRIMFWPSRSVDGAEFTHRGEGEWLCPDTVLEEYENWQDWGEWPTSSREDIDRDPSKKADDPYTKPGAIGAFNRAFEIPHAIYEFDLPYTPSGMGDDRYSFTGGSSIDGAIYYADDGHLYSWHESDPARGNHNAWDLVRLHKFGHLDTDSSVPIGKRESQKHMQAFALACESVTRQLASADGFEDLGPPEADGPAGQGDVHTERPSGDDSGQDNGGGVSGSAFTFDSFSTEIDNRTEPLDAERRRHLIRRIAAANLDPADTGVLAAKIKSACVDPAPSKAEILDSIKRAVRDIQTNGIAAGGPTDIELDLLDEVLEEWFAAGAHIKRIGRQFWTYESGVWIRREDEWIRSKVQRTFIRLRVERPNDSASLVAAMSDMSTSSATAHLWSMFCAYVTGLDASRDPMGLMKMIVEPVINCRNGELHFNADGTYEFTHHHPELFLTAQIPVDWDPDADTAEWDKFCQILFHDSLEADEMQRHLEEAGGYILQPWRDLATFFLMKGEPLAGKSTFGTLLNTLVGESSSNNPLKSYGGGNNHDTAGLVGKILLLDEDFNKGDLLPDGFIKRISEAKRITANPKGKDEFEFVCRAVPMVICNAWPATRDYSGALDRRLVAWDLAAIPKSMQDDAARKRLLSSGTPGVLRRFVEGFSRLYARGEWSLPDECVTAGALWKESTDVVQLWIRECCRPQEGAFLNRSEVHGLFQQWYRDSLPGRPVLGKQELLSRLGGHFGEPVKRRGVFGWPSVTYVGTDFE